MKFPAIDPATLLVATSGGGVLGVRLTRGGLREQQSSRSADRLERRWRREALHDTRAGQANLAAHRPSVCELEQRQFRLGLHADLRREDPRCRHLLMTRINRLPRSQFSGSGLVPKWRANRCWRSHWLVHRELAPRLRPATAAPRSIRLRDRRLPATNPPFGQSIRPATVFSIFQGKVTAIGFGTHDQILANGQASVPPDVVCP